MSFGMLKKFEDFCPLTDDTALIVCGTEYTHLTELTKVKYKIKGNKVHLFSPTILLTGTYLRLGNVFDGKLMFSDEYSVYTTEIKNPTKRTYVCEGIQPYLFELGAVYQKRGSIYLNHDVIIPPWDDYIVAGRPTVYNNWIYFEARIKPAPQGWEIWRYDLTSKKKEMVLNYGGNPYVYAGKMFYSHWVTLKRILGMRPVATRFQALANLYAYVGWQSAFETRYVNLNLINV